MKNPRDLSARFRYPCLVLALGCLFAAQAGAQAETSIANDAFEVDPTEGRASIIDVLANDSNTEGLPPVITGVSGSCTGGTLTWNPSTEEEGLYLVFTPNANFDGHCQFQYSAGTEAGDSVFADVVIKRNTDSDPTTPLPSANLLTNPGFEDGLTGWTAVVRDELAGHTGFVHGGNGIAAANPSSGEGGIAAYAIHNLANGWFQRSDQINSAVGTAWTLIFDVAWVMGHPTEGGWRASVIRKHDDHLDAAPSLVDIAWQDGAVTCSSAACTQSSGGDVAPGFTRFEFPFVDSGDQPLNVRFELLEASGHAVFDNVRMLKNPTANNPNDKLASRNGDFESGSAYWETHVRAGFPNTSLTPTDIYPSAGQTTFVMTNLSGGYVESTGLPVLAGHVYSLVPKRRGKTIEECESSAPNESFTAWTVSLAFQNLSGQILETRQVSNGAACDPIDGVFSPSPSAHNSVVTAPAGAVAARVRLHQHLASGWVEYDASEGAMELVDQTNGNRRTVPSDAAAWTLYRTDGFGGTYQGPGVYADTQGIWHLTNRARGHLKSDRVRVSDDATYRLSGWERGLAKGTLDGNSRIEARFFAENGTTHLGTEEVVRQKIPSTTWTEHSLEFAAPSSAAWVEVRLYNDDSHGFVAFDDIELIQLTGTVPSSAPVLDDKSYTVAEDSFANVLDLLATEDPELELISAAKSEAGVILAISSDARSVTYTPRRDWSGEDRFSFDAVDAQGRVASATATIEVLPTNDPPRADLQVTCTDHGSSATCVASAAGSTDPENDPLTFRYQFEGQWTQNPTHTFSTGGPKTIWLEAVDTNGLTDLTFSYVFLDLDPIADVQVACNGAECTIDIGGSTDDDALVFYEVNCGDGQSRFGTYSPLSTTFDHVYAQSGDYQVSLEVRDSSGATDTASTLAVVDLLPVAAFEVERRLLAVDFDASGSSDDRGIATYAWDFGDGQVGSGSSPQHVYADDGTYTVALTVTDSGGQTGSTSREVRVISKRTVASLIPVLFGSKVDPAPTAEMLSSCTDLECTLDPNGSSDARAILRLSVDWGDGSDPIEQDWSAESTANTLTHTYAAPGNYTVKLTVFDASNGSDTTTAALTVTEAQAASASTGGES